MHDRVGSRRVCAWMIEFNATSPVGHIAYIKYYIYYLLYIYIYIYTCRIHIFRFAKLWSGSCAASCKSPLGQSSITRNVRACEEQTNTEDGIRVVGKGRRLMK